MMNGQLNSSGRSSCITQVIRLAVGLSADARLGQLREADRQVDVGARIVDAPAAAVAVAGVAET